MFAVYDIEGKFQLLGRGTYGAVLTPPINCPEEDPRARRMKGRVGKLFFDMASADAELQRDLLVQNNIDRTHKFTTITLPHVCNVKEIENDLWGELSQEKPLFDKLKNVIELKKVVPQIISEKVPGTSWSQLRDIPLKQFLKMLFNAVQALYIFAEGGYQHCDVTPRNLMWGDNKQGAKLIDYGMTTVGSDILRTYCMTPYQYFPPEFAFLGALRTIWRKEQDAEPDEAKKAAILARQEVTVQEFAIAVKAACDRYRKSIQWATPDDDVQLKERLDEARACWVAFASTLYDHHLTHGTTYKQLLTPYVGKTDVYALGVCVYEMTARNKAILFDNEEQHQGLLELVRHMTFPTPGPRDSIPILVNRIKELQERLFGKRASRPKSEEKDEEDQTRRRKADTPEQASPNSRPNQPSTKKNRH